MGGVKNSETGKISTWNFLNPEISSVADEAGVFGPGSTALHELSEGHEAAKFMKEQGNNHASPATLGESNSVFDHANSKAYPQMTNYFVARMNSNGGKLSKKEYSQTHSVVLYTRSVLTRENIILKEWKK